MRRNEPGRRGYIIYTFKIIKSHIFDMNIGG